MFKVSANDVFIDNPQLEAIPEFAELSNMQMKYVILAYDYKSALRHLKPKHRKEKAAKIAGYTMEKDGKRLGNQARAIINGNIEVVNAAIKEYLEIQRDRDMEALRKVDDAIDSILDMELANDSKTLEKDIKVLEKLDDLYSLRNRLAEKMGIREESISDSEMEAQATLSTLDILNEEKDD